MIVYCNGDSFVAGVELGDDILPEYPGALPFNASNEIREKSKQWIDKTYDNTHLWSTIRRSNNHLIKLHEKNKAWPNKLSSLLGVSVINSAQGGASMDRIARTSISDLIALKKQHERIVAVIGITEPSRAELANEEYNWHDVILHINYDSDILLHSLVKYKIYHETEYHHMVNFLKNVILIKDFCKLNDIELFWVTPIGDPMLKVEPNRQDYQDLLEYADFKPTIEMLNIARGSGLPDVILPSYHWAESIHALVAQKLSHLIKVS